MQRALQLKLALITEAAAKRASWAARSGVVSSDITQQQQEVQRLEGVSSLDMDSIEMFVGYSLKSLS